MEEAIPQNNERGPLTDKDHEALAEAGKLVRQLNGVQSMAGFNIVSYMICLMLSVLIALFSPGSWIVVGLLAVLIIIETQGKNMFARLDPKGGKLLIWNQLLILTIITLYCAYQILNVYQNPNQFDESIRQYPELKGYLQGASEMMLPITIGFYGAVFLLSLLFQGMVARYYHKRMKMLSTYLADTPKWIVQMQKSQR